MLEQFKKDYLHSPFLMLTLNIFALKPLALVQAHLLVLVQE